MDELEILGIAKTYTKETVIGMGALKGAPCTVQGIVDNGDGTQTLTLRWTDTTGTTHDSTITLPSAIFAITNPQNGQSLKYNSTSGKFENSNTAFSADLGDLDDVVITTVQNGQVLSYDSATGKWINKTVSIAADLGDLDDVTIASVSNGQVLAYNSASSKWKNISLGTAAAKNSTNAVTQNDTDLVESGAVYTAIDDAVKALDVTDTAVAGSYVTEVSETDGKIAVTREAADATPTQNSNKMVKSGGVYTALADKVDKTDVGVANGVAELGADGKVPSSQLPSYVSDVVNGYLHEGKFYKESTYQTEITPEDDKIYINLDSENTYRWSGLAYVEISQSLALGETSSTAYRGDRGKTAYDFSQSPYTSNPEMNGTASAGSSTSWARGDHVHPRDTSKVDTIAVNGVNQTVTLGAVDLDVANNLITDAQWTTLSTLYS